MWLYIQKIYIQFLLMSYLFSRYSNPQSTQSCKIYCPKYVNDIKTILQRIPSQNGILGNDRTDKVTQRWCWNTTYDIKAKYCHEIWYSRYILPWNMIFKLHVAMKYDIQATYCHEIYSSYILPNGKSNKNKEKFTRSITWWWLLSYYLLDRTGKVTIFRQDVTDWIVTWEQS